MTDSRTVPGAAPAVRGESRPTVTRSARAPARDPPRVRPAQAGVPGAGRGPGQLGRGEVAALLGGQPLAELDAAGLLEQVDDGLAVAAQGERAARGEQRAGRADAVGQVGLGGRAEARVAAAAAQPGHVGGPQVGGVHRLVRGPSAPASPAPRPGCAGRRPGRPGSRPAARTGATCSGATRSRAQAMTGAELTGRDGAHGVDGGADPAAASSGRLAASAPPGRPGLGVAVAEAQLRRRPAAAAAVRARPPDR